MTTKAKTTKMCGNCSHKYDVQYNTPTGLKTNHYCRHKVNGSDFGFSLVKLNGLCKNYKHKDNGED